MKRCPRTGLPGGALCCRLATPRSRFRPAGACARRPYSRCLRAGAGRALLRRSGSPRGARAQIRAGKRRPACAAARWRGRAEKRPCGRRRVMRPFSPNKHGTEMQAAETGLEGQSMRERQSTGAAFTRAQLLRSARFAPTKTFWPLCSARTGSTPSPRPLRGHPTF